MEVLKVARDGTQTMRLTARGTIAVTATHGARGHPCLAAKHTEQVARQAAAHQALLCAEHLTLCASHRPDLCEPIIITLPNATTARGLSPSRPTGKSAHRNVASNNLRRLQRKQAGVSVALHTLLVVPRLHDRAPRPARDSECPRAPPAPRVADLSTKASLRVFFVARARRAAAAALPAIIAPPPVLANATPTAFLALAAAPTVLAAPLPPPHSLHTLRRLS
eukprot:scaffold13199_cov59-Phaeocystis_antarctica.AAC.2